MTAAYQRGLLPKATVKSRNVANIGEMCRRSPTALSAASARRVLRAAPVAEVTSSTVRQDGLQSDVTRFRACRSRVGKRS